MSTVIEHRSIGDLTSLSQFPPVLQRILSARNVVDPETMEYGLSQLLPFDDLLNINQAVARLMQALAGGERILIVGDFDVDGATSTTLAVLALRAMGAKDVDYLVPNRFDYGYGLSPEIVDVAHQSSPDLIVTVDNGISSVAGVARARELGIDVLVTDHHLPGEVLPEDCILINPSLPEDKFPSTALAGVGVIFYVMVALRSGLKDNGWFDQQQIACPKMSDYLDLVALGTVADLVPLDKNNRVLVHQGLARIRQFPVRPGLQALINVSKREAATLLTSDFGFAIAPRLNAAGRLDDMSLGIECLLTQDAARARDIAEQLDQLNVDRKLIEQQMKQEAIAIVERLSLADESACALTLYEDSWHQGVVGLVASRIKDKTHYPVIAFASVGDGTLKGSGRSIPGLNLRDVLARMDAINADLIIKFGGHAMAAGLSIHERQLNEFTECFNRVVAEMADPNIFQKKWLTDGVLSSHDLTLDMAHLLRHSGPWGQAFPEPVFDGVFDVIEQRLVGGHHLKLTLQHPDGQYPISAICFNVDLKLWPNYDCRQVQVVYRLDINAFRNQTTLQLMIDQLWGA
ncbi:MAG: single-stranded-DNA-specific exonuclease RecJ [Legionellales bacterium]|nr:single-stranded-DNA-specific exonuclease RecJ [Legionellales bacterium]HAG61710.1 single-stranded-DNA-specific exonuclease RecJ [Coxiellaceae bacterium]